MNAIRKLERAALLAHHRGEKWNAFWAKHEEQIKTAVPRDRFSGFYKRLFCLLLCGDLDGREPIGSDECSWEKDDESHKPHDTQTAARLLWQPEEVTA
jgi:hypothetical protein